MKLKYRAHAGPFALIAMAALPLASLAAEEGGGNLEEVIVTATKRESTVQKVPFSIAAVTSESIRESGAANLVDLARNVVGLTIADLGPGQSQMAIRGISAGQVIRDQPGVKEQVGVYLDESPISVALFTPDLDLYDLNRLEVLRGPQGTLFGAGSTSGTVRYITNQPSLHGFDASAEATVSTVDKGGAGGNIKGMVNLPLGDVAALRAVGFYNRLPGFIDARQPDGSVRKDVNTGDRTGGRLALLIAPTEALEIMPRVTYQHLKTNGYPRADLWNILGNPTGPLQNQPADNFGPYEQYRQQREGIDDKFLLGDLKVQFSFGGAALTSNTSYTDRKVVVLRDASQLTGSVTVDIGGTPAQARLDSPLYDRSKLKVWSQELRLASTGDNVVDWLVGGFYQHVKRDYGQDLPTPGYDAVLESVEIPPNPVFFAPVDTPFWSDLHYTLKQYGLFGEATWHATDQWALTGGLRYYNFKEDRTLRFAGFFSDPTNPAVYPHGIPGNTDSNGISPRVIASYRMNDNVTFNAQMARGFRLGGINDPINLPLCSDEDKVVFGNQKNWKDEKNTNYELGFKMRSSDRRYTFNVSAFLSDITDLQATTTAGTCSSRIVFNVPKARSQGIEAEIYARPDEHWDFGLSLTAVDAKLRSSVTSTLANGDTVVVGGLSEGARLPTAAKIQWVGSIGYTQPGLVWSKDLFTALTWQYNGSSYSQFENETANFGLIGAGGARIISLVPTSITSYRFDPLLPAYNLFNFRVGLKDAHWELAAFANNLLNKRAPLALDYERGRSARVGQLVNQPRTIGVQVDWKY